MKRYGGGAAGRKLDSGQVEDGEQARVSGGAAGGIQKERRAAGSGIGPEDCQECVKQVRQGDTDEQAAGGRVQHAESGYAERKATKEVSFKEVEARVAGAPELDQEGNLACHINNAWSLVDTKRELLSENPAIYRGVVMGTIGGYRCAAYT